MTEIQKYKLQATEIIKQSIYNDEQSPAEITKQRIDSSDTKILEYVSELKEILFESNNADIYNLICNIVPYIVESAKREKEIEILSALYGKFVSMNLNVSENKNDESDEKHGELLGLADNLRSKIQNFNEKLKYGDKLINNLLVGFKEHIKKAAFMDKLLSESSKISPYTILLFVFVIFLVMFLLLKSL